MVLGVNETEWSEKLPRVVMTMEQAAKFSTKISFAVTWSGIHEVQTVSCLVCIAEAQKRGKKRKGKQKTVIGGLSSDE